MYFIIPFLKEIEIAFYCRPIRRTVLIDIMGPQLKWLGFFHSIIFALTLNRGVKWFPFNVLFMFGVSGLTYLYSTLAIYLGPTSLY